jgi:hypothetical protein
MTGVTVTGGRSVAEDISASNPDQPWTLARGAAVAFVRGAQLGRYGAETRSLMDDYRRKREAAGFAPKGDYLLGRGGGP